MATPSRELLGSHEAIDQLHASTSEIQADCRPLVLAVLNQASSEEDKAEASRDVARLLRRRIGGRLHGGDIVITNPVEQTITFADGETASWAVLVSVQWQDGADGVTWLVTGR